MFFHIDIYTSVSFLNFLTVVQLLGNSLYPTNDIYLQVKNKISEKLDFCFRGIFVIIVTEFRFDSEHAKKRTRQNLYIRHNFRFGLSFQPRVEAVLN